MLDSNFRLSQIRWNRGMVFAISFLCLIWLGVSYHERWSSTSSSIRQGGTVLLLPKIPATQIIQTSKGNAAAAYGQHASIKSGDGSASAKETAAANSPKASSRPVSEQPTKSPLLSLDPTRVALLLETRPLPHLPALLSHFISVLPSPWSFRFVGSPEANALITSSSLSSHIKTGKLVVTALPARYSISSQESISMALTDLSFYKDFLAPAEWVLFFQSDSIICAASEHSIDDWVSANYSWVGAPWNMAVRGGNGGLSLRHIPPIIKVLEKETRQPGSSWEDRWLCDRLEKMDAANMPGPEIEAQFSVESQWTDKPFGYHLRGSGKSMVPEIWENEKRRKHILDYCPEVKIVLDMEILAEVTKLRKEIKILKATARKDRAAKYIAAKGEMEKGKATK